MTSLIVEQLHWQTLELKPKNGKFPMWRLQQKPVKTSIKFSSTSWEKFEREKWTPMAITKKKRTNHERKLNALSYKEKKTNKKHFFSVWYVLIKIWCYRRRSWIISLLRSGFFWNWKKKIVKIVPLLLFNFLLNFWDQFKNTAFAPSHKEKRFLNFIISKRNSILFCKNYTNNPHMYK